MNGIEYTVPGLRGLEDENDGLMYNVTNSTDVIAKAEEEHEYDALTTLFLNLCLICCLMLAYYVKKFRIYSFPESTGALLVGCVIGGAARLYTDNLALFEFSPELFFFIFLPPIIFEAGYSLDQKDFFQNIGAITLFAMFGTIISTFVVGYGIFFIARLGLLGHSVDRENPMEALLFGALISAVDPVATLSIMGNAELRCDPLLYSLVFGESVLNDAIAISLFRTFADHYSSNDFTEAQIPTVLISFAITATLSIGVGVFLGLVASFLYKHTDLHRYPHLETSLLFCFCYLCYSTGEALELSGIMALFFQGLVLAHYNSFNLSETAHVASEQIFSTLATISETAVFLYMGMDVFTGRFKDYNVWFSVVALLFCLIGRMANIFPLSWLANRCRTGRHRITGPMQFVLWFAGLRGAIAFALAMNMPGPNGEEYATATLSICIFTTVVCGSMTERMLHVFGMKQPGPPRELGTTGEGMQLTRLTYKPVSQSQNGHRDRQYPLARKASRHVYHGAKRLWKQLDDDVLKIYFGGSQHGRTVNDSDHDLRALEMRQRSRESSGDSGDHFQNGDDSSFSDNGEQDSFIN